MKKKTYSKPEVFYKGVTSVTDIAFLLISTAWDVSPHGGWDNMQGED